MQITPKRFLQTITYCTPIEHMAFILRIDDKLIIFSLQHDIRLEIAKRPSWSSPRYRITRITYERATSLLCNFSKKMLHVVLEKNSIVYSPRTPTCTLMLEDNICQMLSLSDSQWVGGMLDESITHPWLRYIAIERTQACCFTEVSRSDSNRCLYFLDF